MNSEQEIQDAEIEVLEDPSDDWETIEVQPALLEYLLRESARRETAKATPAAKKQ